MATPSVSFLLALKAWLETIISEKGIQAQRPEKGNTALAYSLVAPAVHIGLIPPGHYLPADDSIRIPCITIGIMERGDDNDGSSISLRLTAAIYDPGHQEMSAGNALSLAPNFDGYITLLNLLDSLAASIMSSGRIADSFELASLIKTSVYEEQPWPYWYGALTFTVDGAPYARLDYAEFLS